MTLTIYFPKSASPLPLEKLATLLPPDVALIPAADAPPPDCDILVHGFPERAWLEACPALRAVIVPFAGVPAATHVANCCARKDLPIPSSPTRKAPVPRISHSSPI